MVLLSNEKIKQLITNMEVGYKYWEYYTNVMPFITQYTKNLYYTTNDEIYLINIYFHKLLFEVVH